MADELQAACDASKLALLRGLLIKVLSLKLSVVPVRSKAGSNLLLYLKNILELDNLMLCALPQCPIKHSLVDEPYTAGISNAVRKLKSEKAPRLDGLCAEVFSAVGCRLK